MTTDKAKDPKNTIPKLVNVKKAHLNQNGYTDIREWMSYPNNVYIGRKMRIFIHNKVKALEPPGTKTMMDCDTRFIYTPVEHSDKKGYKDGKSLLDYPNGSYVNKKGLIVEFYQLPESPWHNPFRLNGKDGPDRHNPFRIAPGRHGHEGSGSNGHGHEKDGRESVVNNYQEYLLKSPLIARLGELKGKILGCWCTPKACHGDIIIAAYEKKITQ